MWARVDDGWWSHPKVVDLSLAAKGLWIAGLSWSCGQRLDTIPDGIVRMIGGSKTEANELLSVCLWERVEGGYRIHDWHRYQDLSISEKRAEAGRKGGVRSRPPGSKPKQTDFASEANGEAGPSHPIPTHTNPTKTQSVALVEANGSPATPAKTQQYRPAFEAFNSAYPRKAKKGEAAKAYERARKLISDELLLSAAEKYAFAYRASGRNPDFIPYPATWLNGRCWDDPLPEPEHGGKSQSAVRTDRILEQFIRDSEGNP
jgi:hypothetical protein